MTCRPLLLAAAAGALLTTSPGAQQPVFRSHAEVVAVDVLVVDRNRPVAGLTVADFELHDNGVPQTILDVSRERVPLDVTLAIDTSGSVHRRLLASLVRAVNTVRERLRPEDRVAVLTFADRIREHVALTAAAGVSPIAIDRAAGATSLNDAIAAALMMAPPDLERRRMAIVFTDGIDTISVLDEAAVLDVARRTRTALFIVAAGPPPRSSLSPPPRRGRLPLPVIPEPPVQFFEELADITGGRLQMVPHVPFMGVVQDGNVVRGTFGGDERLLDAPFLRALEDFRTSYVLRYAPTGVASGGWHEITVRVPKGRGRYQIRARRGYTGEAAGDNAGMAGPVPAMSTP
jgi:hypothetical protein